MEFRAEQRPPLARSSLIYEIIPTPAIDHCLANNIHFILFIKIF
jgi:hypothetical protein